MINMRISSQVLNFDLSTRRKRRLAMSFIIKLLEMIYYAERNYMKKLPANMHGLKSYAVADDAIIIIDAIDILWSVYND